MTRQVVKNNIGFIGLLYLNFFVLLNYLIRIIWDFSDILEYWSIADFFRLNDGLFSDVFFIYQKDVDGMFVIIHLVIIAYFWAYIEDGFKLSKHSRKIWELTLKLIVVIFVSVFINVFLKLVDVGVN
jgi:hypothetical protein